METKPDLSTKKESSGRSMILRGLSFVFLLVAIVSGYMFYKEFEVYSRGGKAYDAIAALVAKPGDELSTMPAAQVAEQTQVAQQQATQSAAESDPARTAEGSSAAVASANPAGTPSPEQKDFQRISRVLSVDYDKLNGLNPDALGWILSEGTRINYPLVQGKDNAYYLNHLVNGEFNKLGSIFMDYRNKRDFSDEHTFIFGHNMNDGSMFNDLEKYKDPAYYPDHKYIYIFTADQIYRLDVLAAYLTEPRQIGQLYFNYESPEQKQKYIDDAIRMSNFQTDVAVSPQDRIVSLFTCDYATADSRYVVVAKLVPLNP